MKIKGNTVGTPIPRSNYNQTDPKKADYLVGRENIVDKDNLASVTEEILAQAKASGEFNGSDGKDGVNGKDGTSVAITGITESDEDGGENVVTFSDGKTLTVKNGNKGGDGEGGGGNSVYFSEEEPTDAKTGDFWYDESEDETIPIPRIGMLNTDTAATIEPNKLYVFPEMASLDITFGGDADISVVQEYRFRFTSGATATTLTLPADVVGEITVEANKVYEVSILDGYLVSQSWEVS